eukprot:jgi/Mesen1/5086/ME000252S04205
MSSLCQAGRRRGLRESRRGAGAAPLQHAAQPQDSGNQRITGRQVASSYALLAAGLLATAVSGSLAPVHTEGVAEPAPEARGAEDTARGAPVGRSAEDNENLSPPAGLIRELVDALDEERVVVDEDERHAHAKPWNSYHRVEALPWAVVFPRSTEEVAAVVKACARHKAPLTPYAGGTSLEGHTTTPHAGISMDMSLMKVGRARERERERRGRAGGREEGRAGGGEDEWEGGREEGGSESERARAPARGSGSGRGEGEGESFSVCVPQLVSRLEMMDEVMMRAVNAANGYAYAERPTLLFELTGLSEASVKEQVARVQAIAAAHAGSHFEFAETPEQKAELWRARKEALWSCALLKPGGEAMITDVCVPLSRLADCVSETKDELARSCLPAPMLAHAGDGNVHVIIMVDASKPDELAEAKRLARNITLRALAMDGTCTGEHGIGTGKRQYLEQELGANAVTLMATIKKALDPDNIMNPGKILLPRFCH